LIEGFILWIKQSKIAQNLCVFTFRRYYLGSLVMIRFIKKSVSDFIRVSEDLTRSPNGDFMVVCIKDIFFDISHE